jgi:pyruvate formate lyase activating enzyme
MILAGFQKNSFIDYPGKISCVLFTSGCNFTCPYCHNAALARGEYPARIESSRVTAFLESRRGLLEGAVVTGGEPTLSPDLLDLCRAVKSMGYPLKLDTNGSRPEVLRQLLDQHLVDFIAMDIKAPLGDYYFFSSERGIGDKLTASIALIMEAAPAYEFRTTCVAPFVNEAAITAIAATIEGAACYVLQPFNPMAACLEPAFNRRQDPSIPATQMQRFKTVAARYVKRCLIR